MNRSNFVETEIHTGNQVRYKVLTEIPSIEAVMDSLLENNNSSDVQKIVIQPRNKIEEHIGYLYGATGKDNTPWVKNKPWTVHDRLQKCSNL